VIPLSNKQINRVAISLNLSGFYLAEMEEKAVISILETTATDGKNYLVEEISRLERTVSGFFDYIGGIIERRYSFTMKSFADSVNKFLTFNEYRVLEGHGSISRQQAEARAFTEYEKFNETQRIESDFDRVVKDIEKKKPEDEE